MKDRSTLLLALLAANDRLGQAAVYRTTLVKQAFLAETIRPLYRIWIQMFRFVRDKHGPYNADIFDRLDILIFSGLVEVVSYLRRGERKTEARYRVTDAGHQLLDELNPCEIKTLATDLVWALQSLGVDQASTICQLVYQEAEFARIFAQHNQQGIGPESKVPLPSVTAANNETFVTLALVQELLPRTSEHPDEVPLPSREVVRLFLMSLAVQLPGALHDREAST